MKAFYFFLSVFSGILLASQGVTVIPNLEMLPCLYVKEAFCEAGLCPRTCISLGKCGSTMTCCRSVITNMFACIHFGGRCALSHCPSPLIKSGNCGRDSSCCVG